MQRNTFLQTTVAVMILSGILTSPLYAQFGWRAKQKSSPPQRPSTQNSASTRGMGGGATKSTPAPVKSTEPPKKYAILIGVNEYKQQKKLDYCAKDMQGLKDALIKGKFTTEDCVDILVSDAPEISEQPTMANINRTLKNLAAKTKENDTVLLAFAGHGVSLPSRRGGTDFQQYLCPSDAEVEVDADTGRIFTDTLLPLKEIDRLLVEESKAKTRIMFLDACRDKEVIFKTRSLNDSNREIDMLADLKSIMTQKLETSGLFRLSSCADNQKAYEDPGAKHGVFSHFLIHGLGGAADENGDKQITLSELNNYVSLYTEHYVRTTFKDEQTPTFSSIDARNPDSLIMAFCEPKVERQETPAVNHLNVGGSSTGNSNFGTNNYIDRNSNSGNNYVGNQTRRSNVGNSSGGRSSGGNSGFSLAR